MSTTYAKDITVGMISLGCAKNRVDSEHVLGYLSACGYTVTNKPDKAAVIIINTCGFIDTAKEESINTILEMAEYKTNGTCKLLCVIGCLSERYRKELTAELPEVDLFWGVKDGAGFVAALSKQLGVIVPQGCENASRVLTTPFYSAYLRIADGCRNRCTYCAIPLIRGDMKSESMSELVLEARRLADIGVTELNVIAQDTSAYGIDTCGKLLLPELLERLTQVGGIHVVRLLYTYPDTVTDELISCIATNERIANYIDMPIQHISDRVLSLMNRRGSGDLIRDRIQKIRAAADDFIIRSTALVGFPGETEADFAELCDFVSEYRLDRLGVFSYSAEDNTPAASFSGQVDEHERELRANHLMILQRDISLKRNESRVGTVTEVLVEKVLGNKAWGRSYAEAPEVDGTIIAKTKGERVLPGEYVKVLLEAADEYDIEGVIQ